jgi:hypothetical protein
VYLIASRSVIIINSLVGNIRGAPVVSQGRWQRRSAIIGIDRRELVFY